MLKKSNDACSAYFNLKSLYSIKKIKARLVPIQAEKKSEFPKVEPIPAPVGNFKISKNCRAPAILTKTIATKNQLRWDWNPLGVICV